MSAGGVAITTASPRQVAWQRAVERSAVVLLFYVIAVAAVLAGNSLRLGQVNPYTSPVLAQWKQAQRAAPNDHALRVRIQQLDVDMRTEFFYREHVQRSGIWYLMGGMLGLLLATNWAFTLRRPLPCPQPAPVDPRRIPRLARYGVGVLGVMLATGLAVTAAKAPPDRARAYLAAIRNAPEAPEVMAIPVAQPVTPQDTPPPMPPAPPPPNGPPPVVPPPITPLPPVKPLVPPKPVQGESGPDVTDLPTLAAWVREWPQFRGSSGIGFAVGEGYPTQWNGTKGEGILWKTPIPLAGQNSPVVWGQRIFLAGATEQKREVYCLDADKGAILWTRQVDAEPKKKREPPHVMDDTGYAAPTMAVDGARAYALFGNGDLACFDMSGKSLWTRALGTPDNMYGHASSLLLMGNRLIMQFDQGGGGEGSTSALLAVNVGTGKTAWEIAREAPNSWSTPILIRTPKGAQIITTSDPWVIAYAPEDGREIWRAECLSGDVAPSPIYAGGLVLVCTAYANFAAIRPDGTGDVTKTHIAWMVQDALPDTVSPISNGELVFLLTSEGLMTCFEVQTGKRLWEQQLDGSFHASPVLVGNLLYVINTSGTMRFIDAARTYTEIGTAALGEGVHATPAFREGRIYLRGTKHVYAIGRTP